MTLISPEPGEHPLRPSTTSLQSAALPQYGIRHLLAQLAGMDREAAGGSCDYR